MWNKYIFAILAGVTKTIFADNCICVDNAICANCCIFDMCAGLNDCPTPQNNIAPNKSIWVNFNIWLNNRAAFDCCELSHIYSALFAEKYTACNICIAMNAKTWFFAINFPQYFYNISTRTVCNQ